MTQPGPMTVLPRRMVPGLDEGVGADDAARPDDGAAPQDGAGQDDSPRRDLHRLVDRDGAAVDLHAVCDVPQQHRLAGGLGLVQRPAGGGQGLGGVVPAFHSHIDTSKCRPGDAPAKAPAAPGRKDIGYKAGWVPNLSHYILT